MARAAVVLERVRPGAQSSKCLAQTDRGQVGGFASQPVQSRARIAFGDEQERLEAFSLRLAELRAQLPIQDLAGVLSSAGDEFRDRCCAWQFDALRHELRGDEIEQRGGVLVGNDEPREQQAVYAELRDSVELSVAEVCANAGLVAQSRVLKRGVLAQVDSGDAELLGNVFHGDFWYVAGVGEEGAEEFQGAELHPQSKLGVLVAGSSDQGAICRGQGEVRLELFGAGVVGEGSVGAVWRVRFGTRFAILLGKHPGSLANSRAARRGLGACGFMNFTVRSPRLPQIRAHPTGISCHA